MVALSAIAAVAPRVGYPRHKSSLIMRLELEGARRSVGEAQRGQQGFLYEAETLPACIKRLLCNKPGTVSSPLSLEVYTSAPPRQKREADARMAMMMELKQFLDGGAKTNAAYAATAEKFACSVPTVKRAWKAVRNADEGHWLELLVKAYSGREPDPIDDRILRYFYRDYGRPEQPQLQAVWERTVKEAEKHGWGDVPSAKTLKRRFDKLPIAERTLMREGEAGLDARQMSIDLDRSGMKPMDSINADGREWDVLVDLPDGRRVRRIVVVVQDEATNKVLGWVDGETESTELYREVLCQVFTEYGIPRQAKFDNTRAAANKTLTAGASNRKRFKDKPDDIDGLLIRVGCRPFFTKVRNGRSKPVERALLDLKERSEKHPDAAGAYTGRSPSEKPANYGARAISLETFRSLMREAVKEYNERGGRRSKVAFGISYDEAFESGLASTQVRKFSDEQRRSFFLDGERRTVSPSGEIWLGKLPHRRRYYSAAVREYAGREVIVRFDPKDFNAPVLVETLDGTRIDGQVPLIAPIAFNDQASAKAYERAKREEKQAVKRAVAARQRADRIEQDGFSPAVAETTPAPSAPVIAPNFKRKPASRGPASSPSDAERLSKGLARIEQKARYG